MKFTKRATGRLKLIFLLSFLAYFKKKQYLCTKFENISIMKRLICIMILAGITAVVSAQLMIPSAQIYDDLKGYKHVYVTPTKEIIAYKDAYGIPYSDNGIPPKRLIPSEAIKDYLIQMGHHVLPSIKPELASKTLVVSFGYAGQRQLNTFALSFASGAIIRISDAKTNKTLATYRAESFGRDEADNTREAIFNALDLFTYSLSPKMIARVQEASRSHLTLSLTNKTPYYAKEVTVRLSYYMDGKLVHQQTSLLKPKLLQSETIDIRVKRDKQARNSNYQIKAEVVSYK